MKHIRVYIVLLALYVFAFFAAAAYSAGVTLPTLQNGTSIIDADLFWCRQSAAADPTKDAKCLASAIKAYIQAAIGNGLTNAGSILNTTFGTPDKRLTGGIIYASDRGLYVNYAGASSGVFFISAASATGFTNGWSSTLQATGSGSATLKPDSGTICGLSQITIPSGTNLFYYSYAGNFECDLSSNGLGISVAALPASMIAHHAIFTTDANGSAITAGSSAVSCRRIEYNGTITGWSMIGDVSGSAVEDIWLRSGAVPTVANTITASAKPTLTSSGYIYSSSLTGWTTSVHAGDVMCHHVDSASTITRLTTQIFFNITP